MSSLERMSTRIRFEHGTISELGMHRITSPDIRGFHMGKTYEIAEREALAMVAPILSRRIASERGRVSATSPAWSRLTSIGSGAMESKAPRLSCAPGTHQGTVCP